MVGKTKPFTPTETKLKRIAVLSGENSRMEFNCLMPHFNMKSLTGCFHELDGRKAVGIDRQTKKDYGDNLESNLEHLVSRMKSMSYIPAPVREVLIPKDDGKKRPLGISNFEDKIVQLMMSKVLESIYDPLFHDFSYGFRKGRNCHHAIKALRKHLYQSHTEVVVDVDLQNFFGTISHEKLMAILGMKIKDLRFLRYIGRMLKSGVLSDGELKRTDEGTPQGSVSSPILANIFAHYAIDEWFVRCVMPRVSLETRIFRYADDMVICCKRDEIEKIVKSFKGRMERFSLKLNESKTKVVSFDKTKVEESRQGTFDFLGFTFYLGKARNGRTLLPKIKTCRKRFFEKLGVVREWCKANRNENLVPLWNRFCSKLRGHYQYYGVSFNSKSIAIFGHDAIRIFYKWMNRRSQRRAFNWEQFRKFMEERPPPCVKIHHNLFAV